MDRLKGLKLIATGIVVLFLAACSGDNGFSLGGAQNTFQQSVTRTQVKVDILWVIDNSGSMETSQDNVAANFQHFIQKFQDTNFDYQMAVTATDAWLAPHDGNPQLARFRDGTDDTSHTGVTVITPSTEDLEQTFSTNIRLGIDGSGDERGWQSLKEALSLQANLDEPFPRKDALLAVIFLTDEDDFSHDGSNNVQGLPNPYNNPNLHDPMMYYDFLFDLTESTEGNLNFIVNTIGIFDQQCLDDLSSDGFTGRFIAQRYVGVTDATGGYKGSLCDDFTDVMAGISDSIIEKSTAFKLTREPDITSIVVTVDGQSITMDTDNGWSYDPNEMLIIFHGSSIPGSEAIVNITFDPAGLK